MAQFTSTSSLTHHPRPDVTDCALSAYRSCFTPPCKVAVSAFYPHYSRKGRSYPVQVALRFTGSITSSNPSARFVRESDEQVGNVQSCHIDEHFPIPGYCALASCTASFFLPVDCATLLPYAFRARRSSQGFLLKGRYFSGDDQSIGLRAKCCSRYKGHYEY